MDEPCKIYLDELRERGEEIPSQERNREEDMMEAAQEAFEVVADRLLYQLDFDEEEAVSLTEGFGQTVKEWIEDEEMDWDDLHERLATRQMRWEQRFGVSAP